jgi:hypothetical protein
MADVETRLKSQADAAEERMIALARQRGLMPGETVEAPMETEAKTDELTAHEPTESVPESTPAEPERKPEAQDDGWLQRFKVLQGKYDAEVPRLHEQLRDARRDNDTLRAQMERLQAEVANLKTQEPPKAPEPEYDLAANLGLDDEGAQGMQRYLQSQIDKGVQAALAQINPRLESVTQTVQQTAEERFWAQVTAPDAVPDYWTIKDTAEVGQGLARKAPMTSQTYYHLLAQAYQRGDAQAFIEVMRAVRPPAVSRSPTETPTPEPSPAASKVVPRRAGGGGQPAPAPAMITREQLKALGSEAMKLRARGDWEGADQIERKIDAAVRERRVQ